FLYWLYSSQSDARRNGSFSAVAASQSWRATLSVSLQPWTVAGALSGPTSSLLRAAAPAAPPCWPPTAALEPPAAPLPAWPPAPPPPCPAAPPRRRAARRGVAAPGLACLFEHLVGRRAASGPCDGFLLLTHARVEAAERLVEFLTCAAAASATCGLCVAER